MPAPKCLSIIVCDSVVEDVRSHNKCILNTFNEIACDSFPASHGRLVVFATITDGYGTAPLTIGLVKDDDQSQLDMVNGEITFPDPLKTVDITAELRGIVFLEPGHYSVQMRVGREVIGERRLRVKFTNE